MGQILTNSCVGFSQVAQEQQSTQPVSGTGVLADYHRQFTYHYNLSKVFCPPMIRSNHIFTFRKPNQTLILAHIQKAVLTAMDARIAVCRRCFAEQDMQAKVPGLEHTVFYLLVLIS